jgi:hypothetical protein
MNIIEAISRTFPPGRHGLSFSRDCLAFLLMLVEKYLTFTAWG